MNYVTGNYDKAGTRLQGTINASYDRLVETFGEPKVLDDGKVQVEWAMKFTDGTLATIYDWKEEKTASAVTEWNVGGYTEHALSNVIDEVA
jgi:hypothetical protein